MDPYSEDTAVNAGLMQQASERANKFNILAAVGAMANNKQAAAAAAMADQQQQKRYAPKSLGVQGFALPESGNFIPSPIYLNERESEREQKRSALAATLEARREQEAARIEAQNQRAADANALRMTLAGMANSNRAMLAGMRQGDAAEAKQEKAQVAAAADLDKRVNRFSTALEKGGVPEFEAALQTAEGRLSRHKEGELPGYGRLGSMVPNMMSTDEMQMTRSDMAAAANILLKARSGAAVTESELRRFLEETASGKGMSEAAMRAGWKKLRTHFNARRDNFTSGVGDDVLNTYNERNGAQFTRPTAKPAAGGLSPEDQAELDALRKKFGR
jgi:hypothetical protein